MTLAMTDINDIKKLYFKKGLNVAEIMRKRVIIEKQLINTSI